MATLDDAFAQLWHAVNPDVPLNRDAAIYQAWRSHYADWGSPIGDESGLDTGGVYQCFTHAVISWDADNGVQVASG